MALADAPPPDELDLETIRGVLGLMNDTLRLQYELGRQILGRLDAIEARLGALAAAVAGGGMEMEAPGWPDDLPMLGEDTPE